MNVKMIIEYVLVKQLGYICDCPRFIRITAILGAAFDYVFLLPHISPLIAFSFSPLNSFRNLFSDGKPFPG